MADTPSFVKQLSDIRVSDPVPPPSVNTGSLVGDIAGVASFGLQLLQREQNKTNQEQQQEASRALLSGVNKIVSDQRDRVSQGVGSVRNNLQLIQDINNFKSTLPPGSAFEVDDLVKKSLGFSASSEVQRSQSNQFDQERDFLNARGIDTRDLTQDEVTDRFISVNRAETAAKAKNDQIDSQLRLLKEQKMTRENEQALNRLSQQKVFNAVRSFGIEGLNDQKARIEKARKTGDKRLIQEEQNKFLKMASESVQFTESAMLSVAQQKGIELDPSELNTQRAGVKAWADSLIKSEDNSLISRSLGNRIELANSDVALRLLSQDTEIATYSALSSLKIPLDPISTANIANSAANILAQQPGNDIVTIQENDVKLAKDYKSGGDLLDNLRNMDAAGRLPEGQFNNLFKTKMKEEKDTAALIMDGKVLGGGGKNAEALQLESENVLYNAVNSSLSRGVETGEVSRLGKDQVNYVLETITHPNFLTRGSKEMRDSIASNLPEYTNKVFENVYFNDAENTIKNELGDTEFSVPPVLLTVDSKGSMRWARNPDFSTKSARAETERQVSSNPFLSAISLVTTTQSGGDVTEALNSRVDELVTRLNSDVTGNQLIAANSKMSNVNREELARGVVARSQANISALGRRMFKVDQSIIDSFSSDEETQEVDSVVVEGFKDQDIVDVIDIIKENPEASKDDIVEFLNSRKENK